MKDNTLQLIQQTGSPRKIDKFLQTYSFPRLDHEEIKIVPDQ